VERARTERVPKDAPVVRPINSLKAHRSTSVSTRSRFNRITPILTCAVSQAQLRKLPCAACSSAKAMSSAFAFSYTG
jgi:hypothetical protein